MPIKCKSYFNVLLDISPYNTSHDVIQFYEVISLYISCKVRSFHLTNQGHCRSYQNIFKKLNRKSQIGEEEKDIPYPNNQLFCRSYWNICQNVNRKNQIGEEEKISNIVIITNCFLTTKRLKVSLSSRYLYNFILKLFYLLLLLDSAITFMCKVKEE